MDKFMEVAILFSSRLQQTEYSGILASVSTIQETLAALSRVSMLNTAEYKPVAKT